MTLKVLHVIVGLNVGGAELMLKRLIESQLNWPEYEHSVISLTDIGIIGPQLQAQGVLVSSLEMRNLLGAPKALCSLYGKIRQLQPDIVQTWMYHADLLGGLAARAAGVRNVIWGVRTTDLSKGGKRSTRLIRKLCAFLSRLLPSKIVCAAEASRNAHVKIGYDSSRMEVIPNGFDLSRLVATNTQRDAIRKSCSITNEQIVIGSLGRFNPVKDQANFVEATGILAKRYPSLRFMMVGRGLESSNQVLTNLIEATGYPDRYILLGERQDVPACLISMDIFCLHSKTEGFPNVLGEAMAVGVPCVATDVGDAALLLGGNGIVVPPQDADSLANGLENMIQLPQERRELLANQSKARIFNEFSLERASLRFRDLYDSLIEAHGK
ncbi:glycosyltransferase family 4 protein [Pseudomonas sp. NUPR-001]|uniref:glycosyltransferase family 4 protein n=1 Tax=Pseudomonas sp. NUPR-001 TaxID=3416058 RepID=UPI003F98F2FE